LLFPTLSPQQTPPHPTPHPQARVPLGLKYGADPDEAPRLLAAAAALGLRVVGVSFHVGSACKNLAAFDAAIATARGIFDAGAAAGHTMTVLDIGGGFSGRFDGQGNVVFGEIARTINAALQRHFPAEGLVRVIAEPGRYFAETSAALAVPVYGRRDRPAAGGGVHKDYWLTDGLYGSFNCILYDGQRPQPHVLRSPLLPPLDDAPAADTGSAEGEAAAAVRATAKPAEFSSTLWGPTCDSADYIYKDVILPELRTGDWLVFPDAGAYTVAGACDFNGGWRSCFGCWLGALRAVGCGGGQGQRSFIQTSHLTRVLTPPPPPLPAPHCRHRHDRALHVLRVLRLGRRRRPC
jgi:ornithine decarboxylase